MNVDMLERTIAYPDSTQVLELMELLRYEYIGMFGEPDPNPEGGIEGAYGSRGATVLLSDRVAGAVAVCGVTLDVDDDGRPEAILRRMFTRYDWRRQGLAVRLLVEAETQASRLGAGRLKLETGVEMTAALALYRASGYVPVEPFGYYAGSAQSVFLGKVL